MKKAGAGEFGVRSWLTQWGVLSEEWNDGTHFSILNFQFSILNSPQGHVTVGEISELQRRVAFGGGRRLCNTGRNQ